MGQLEAQMGDGFGQARNLLAWFVVFAHAVGGASLALGFATRWAAAINALVLAGACVIHVVWADADTLLVENLDFQFAMLVLVTLIVFFWQGAGRFSVDALLRSSPETSSAPS
jgi:uncharacterized membrane protein YphA (DoxX/SURF4 family)